MQVGKYRGATPKMGRFLDDWTSLSVVEKGKMKRGNNKQTKKGKQCRSYMTHNRIIIAERTQNLGDGQYWADDDDDHYWWLPLPGNFLRLWCCCLNSGRNNDQRENQWHTEALTARKRTERFMVSRGDGGDDGMWGLLSSRWLKENEDEDDRWWMAILAGTGDQKENSTEVTLAAVEFQLKWHSNGVMKRW